MYVLDDHKHVKFVMSGNTMDIEREAETISRSLSDASGLIVRIRMLEPHEVNREFLTNVYVYAIDPKSNTVVEMEELQEWVWINVWRHFYIESFPHLSIRL